MKNNVEVGGIEPAARAFREFSVRLVRTHSPCSVDVFVPADRDLSLLLEAFKPRQARVAASFTRHVSARTVGLFRCHASWLRRVSWRIARTVRSVETDVEGRLCGVGPGASESTDCSDGSCATQRCWPSLNAVLFANPPAGRGSAGRPAAVKTCRRLL